MNKPNIFASIAVFFLSILFFFAFVNVGSLQELLSDNKNGNNGICSPTMDGLVFCTDAKKISIKSGSDVILNFSIQNTSKEDILVLTSSGLGKYNISVLDGNGLKMLTKLETKKLANTAMSEVDRSELVNSMWTNHHSEILEPDQSLGEKIVLSKTYDFTSAGNYYVEISRKTKDPKNPNGNGFIELPLQRIEIEVK